MLRSHSASTRQRAKAITQSNSNESRFTSLSVLPAATGRYKVVLPPGTYHVSVQGPRGLIGTPALLKLAPGLALSRSFEID